MLDASFDVKWMSSRFRDEVLLGPDMNAKIDDPTSRSLWYIWAESMLKSVSHMAFVDAEFATITLDNQPESAVSRKSFVE